MLVIKEAIKGAAPTDGSCGLRQRHVSPRHTTTLMFDTVMLFHPIPFELQSDQLEKSAQIIISITNGIRSTQFPSYRIHSSTHLKEATLYSENDIFAYVLRGKSLLTSVKCEKMNSLNEIVICFLIRIPLD